MPVICIDGINGSGKTTQADLLAKRICQHKPGAEVHVLCDPGVRGSHPAQELRRLARMVEWNHEMTRALTFMAARCELIAEIEKILSNRRDAWVILDRYIPSFCVYQLPDFLAMRGGMIHDAVATINALHRMCHVVAADATFILDIDPRIGIERYRQASHNPDVFERDESTILALHQRYVQFTQMCPSFDYIGDVSVVEVGTLDAHAVHSMLWDLLGDLDLEVDDSV